MTTVVALDARAEPVRPSRSAHEPEELTQGLRAREARRLAARDRRTVVALAGAFALAATVLAATVGGGRDVSAPVIAALVLAYAVASRVEFEIGGFWAVPTQLLFVPMVFFVPLGAVPLAVAAALTAGAALDVARGRPVRLERLAFHLMDSWHAVGPVLVLWAFGATGAPSWQHWPVYVAALLAQFAFDFASSAIRAVAGLRIRVRELARSVAMAWGVDVSLAPIGLAVAIASVSAPYGFLLVMPLVGLIAYFARERRARIDNALELSSAYRGTALLLGDVVEADDAYTGTHSRDVVGLSLAVAEELRVPPRDLRLTEMTALLHDVGKIRIPSDIINKPGPLDAEERAIVNTHTIEGERLLGRVGGLLGQVGAVVRSCHERWDGGGYPDGLAGEEIHLVARIVCACDAFNAMTTDRPYRAARSTAEALAEMERCAGTHFDPAVVRALVVVAGRDD